VIQKKMWLQSAITKGKNGEWGKYREWSMEGWFLFGFIPLYVRDTAPRKRV
jgi:hypothetical protein